MSATFYLESGEPAAIGATQSLAAVTRLATPPPAAPDASRTQGGADRTSRAGTSLAPGAYASRWSVELEDAPGLVLVERERTVVEEKTGLEIFDRSGAPIAKVQRGPGGVALDAVQRVVYAAELEGPVAAFDLASGARRFGFMGYFGSGFARDVLASRGSRVVLHSFELDAMGTSRARGEVTVLEVLDLGTPIEQKRGLVTSSRSLANLQSRVTPLLVAMDGERPVVAVPGHLLRLDADLRIVSDGTAEFTPLALSVDEAGLAYLWLRAGSATRLWVVTREGARALDREVPFAGATPPVVAYDHRVFLVGADRVLEISADGARAREHEVGRRIAGAIALPDGALLVASGNEIVAIGADGARRVVFALDGETLASPPAVTADGEILAASAGRLHCLASAGGPRP